jgi:hypothetical protein
VRWFAAPALFGAVCAALLAVIRARTRPALPRMSDEWLQTLEQRRDGG